ncbi:MAG: TIR domain-containing protein [Chloroflexi bacterium]|nr:TIR domain-containing protein [Chloroflexota bacterium]
MSDIFISYVEEDSSVATQVGDGLQAAGYSTWLYERDSLPGPAYLLQMGDAIEQAQAVVIIISKDSMASNQVTTEVVRAHEGTKPFIPLLHGVTQTEFQQGQPLWRQAIGASTSIAIDESNIPALAERIVRGLDAMGVHPSQTPTPVAEAVKVPQPAAATPSNNLPVQLTSFIGRESEIQEFSELFDDARCVTLTGIGGSGKTRLALEVGQRRLDSYSDGVWFVDFSPITDESLVHKEVAQALGVEVEALNETLQSRDMLLMLDNCEHVLNACAQSASTWLGQAPNLDILTTSREALGIPGEVVRRISALSVPEESNANPETLMDYESTRLFVERASSAHGAFQITEENSAAIAQIAHRLDGIPLAIELAAARARMLTPQQIATRLDDRFRLLTGGSRTAMPRQRTLQATIDWSYHSLEDEEARLFDKLWVFRGGFTLEAAEQVGAGEGDDPLYIMDSLFQLVDKSMVTVVNTGTDEARYRLLETLRQYAGERLVESGLTDETRRQHATYYLNMTHEANAGLWGIDMLPALNLLETNHDNIRGALEWAIESGERETALRLVGDIGFFWTMHRHINEGDEWCRRAISMDGEVPPDVIAAALHSAGLMAVQLMDAPRAEALYSESLDCYRASDDDMLTARLTFFLAQVPWVIGDIDRAEPTFREALRLNEEYEEDPWSYLFVRYLSSSITASRGEYESAQSTLVELLDIFQQWEHPLGLVHIHIGLGSLALDQGNYANAVLQFEESIPFARMLGDHSMVAVPQSSLAAIAWLQDDRDQAMTLQRQSLAEFKETGSLPGISWALANIRYAMRTLGDVEWMTTLYAQRPEMPPDTAAKSALAETLYSLGRIANIRGDHDRASDILRQCLTLHSEIDHVRGVELALLETASISIAKDDPQRAACLLGAAESAARTTAPTLTDYERLEFERVTIEVQPALDDATFETFRSVGVGMSVEDAVSYALGGSS